MLNNKFKLLQESVHPITILADGRMTGLTYSLILTCLCSEGHSVLISGYGEKSKDYVVREIISILDKEDIIFDVRRDHFCNGTIVNFNDNLNSVTVLSGENIFRYLYMHPSNIKTVCVDNPERLKPTQINEILSYGKWYDSKKVFATNPFECGYRNPDYINGQVNQDEKGNPVYKDYSWDKDLVDWNSIDKTSKGVVTKAKHGQYKTFVNVLTPSHKPFKPMCDVLRENHSWLDKQMFVGEWKC